MYPFALLLWLTMGRGMDSGTTDVQKIVTNEFVVMGEITKVIDTYSAHRRAVISTFLVSFANFYNWDDCWYIKGYS